MFFLPIENDIDKADKTKAAAYLNSKIAISNAYDKTEINDSSDDEADNAAADAKGPAVAQLKPDGRSPRVKSNIKALLSFRGRNPSTKSKVPILREQSEQEQEIPETTREGRTRAGSGRAINLDLVNLIN